MKVRMLELPTHLTQQFVTASTSKGWRKPKMCSPTIHSAIWWYPQARNEGKDAWTPNLTHLAVWQHPPAWNGGSQMCWPTIHSTFWQHPHARNEGKDMVTPNSPHPAVCDSIHQHGTEEAKHVLTNHSLSSVTASMSKEWRMCELSTRLTQQFDSIHRHGMVKAKRVLTNHSLGSLTVSTSK